MAQNRRSRLDFEDVSGPSKALKHLIPVEVFLAAGLVDGEGKEMNRLIIRPKGTPTSSFRYLMPKGAEANMEVPAGWVFDAIDRKLESLDGPIPEEKVDVPVGNPLRRKA
jgi:hypothetical protein